MDGDLTKKVNEIMANPEFQSLVRELRGGEEMPDASEVSAKLPEVLSAFGPMLSGLMGNVGNGEQTAPKPEKPVENAKPAMAKAFLGDPGNRNRLLTALKPYLSRERGVLIDRAISAMQFGEMLGSAGDKSGGGDE